MEALAAYLPQLARVVRDGMVAVVLATELAPGDVLLLAEGDRVSADACFITGALEVNMSALTGESVPVQPAAGEQVTADRLIDAPDAVFSGTVCTSGEARAAVFATGSRLDLAYLGRMGRTDRRRWRHLRRFAVS